LNIGKLHTAESNMVLYGGWAPFDSRNGTALLGDIDLAFLAIYAIGMFFVGHIGDRVDLRILLTIGMIGTGLFTAAFGAGYWLNIHNFYYFLGIQLIAGLFQSNWVAVSGSSCRQLVWEEKEGTNHGNLECSYFCREHIRLSDSSCSPEVWVGLVICCSWCYDCISWAHCVPVLACWS